MSLASIFPAYRMMTDHLGLSKILKICYNRAMKPIEKLFVSDMDGTFLNGQGQYDRRRFEALLDDFEAKGYLFGVASGRGLLALDNLFAGLTNRIAVIAENGGLVRYQGQVLYEQAMTRSEYLEVVDLLETNPYGQDKRFLLSGKAAAYARPDADPAYLTHVQRYYDNVQLLTNFARIDDTIYKLTAKFTQETLPAAITDFNSRSQDFVAVMTNKDSVDIIRRGLDKSVGLTKLCQHLGLPLEHVTAFGDNSNDVELLTLAGRSLAVANGRAEVQELADEVIGTNQTGAVLTYLEQAVADIRLVALDLDNTLFTTDKQISPANRSALQLAQEKGVQVVITTGRPLKAITWLLEDLGLTGGSQYSITFNGGLVQRNDGQILAQAGMPAADVAKVHAVMAVLDLPMDVLSDETVYRLPSSSGFSAYGEVNPNLTFVDLASPADFPSELTYNKVVIVTDQAYLEQRIAKLPADLYDQFEVFKSREIILEVLPKGVHKAAGLAQLTAHLGLEPHQVMTVGDEENDLTMLAWAGWGMAVANAVPAAKAAARLTLEATNNQSAVAEAINRYVLKKGDDHGLI